MTEPHTEILLSNTVEFSEWREEQEFDYHRVQSEVIDYINESIDYKQFDNLIESGSIDEMEWDKLFEQFGIDENSTESETVRNHMETYIEIEMSKKD